VKPQAPASGPHYISCPICKAGGLWIGVHDAIQCPVCHYEFVGMVAR
jgi:hypothetical protein